MRQATKKYNSHNSFVSLRQAQTRNKLLDSRNIKSFQTKILDWYGQNKRDLPWRKTRDPYRIFISEVMAQQTQLSRVIPKYLTWLKKFPTIKILSGASTRDVLEAWSGLGYNRRALYLQKAAKDIVERFDSIFPQDEKELRSLPGIGEYTAKAILCFAFDKQLAVVDTNVRKVILTQFDRQENISVASRLRDDNKKNMTEKELQAIADQLLPVGRAYEWNQALMDYSADVLKKEKIPIPKQSKFKGSDRYYRGQIIKLLIEKHEVTCEQAYKYLKAKENTLDNKRFEKIINNLLRDQFIVIRDKTISLLH